MQDFFLVNIIGVAGTLLVSILGVVLAIHRRVPNLTFQVARFAVFLSILECAALGLFYLKVGDDATITKGMIICVVISLATLTMGWRSMRMAKGGE